MKKLITIGLCICLAGLIFVACGKKGAAPSAGSASPDDMLKMLPAEAQGVFFVDVHNAMAIEALDNAIKDDEDYQKYLEFVEETGIDPKQDIYYVAFAVMGSMAAGDSDAAGVVNLKYDPNALLQVIKRKAEEEGNEVREEDYNGTMLYMMKEAEKDDEGCFAFLDDSNAAVGNPAGVKAILDVVKAQKDNLFKNVELAALLENTKKDTLIWGAMIIPAEASAQAASNPMLSSLGEVNAVTMNFDYRGGSIMAEILARTGDATKNDQIAAALNGIKAFGSMAAAEKPEIGELMNAIDISSAEDHVKISANIPENLINKLKEMATEK